MTLALISQTHVKVRQEALRNSTENQRNLRLLLLSLEPIRAFTPTRPTTQDRCNSWHNKLLVESVSLSVNLVSRFSPPSELTPLQKSYNKNAGHLEPTNSHSRKTRRFVTTVKKKTRNSRCTCLWNPTQKRKI